MYASTILSTLTAALLATTTTARFTIDVKEAQIGHGDSTKCRAEYKPTDDKVSIKIAPDGYDYCVWDPKQGRIQSDAVRIIVSGCAGVNGDSLGHIRIKDGKTIVYERCGFQTCMDYWALEYNEIVANDDHAYTC